MVFQLCLMCGSRYNCHTLCLGARPRYNLVVDEDVKKPNKQTNESSACWASHSSPFLSPVSLSSISVCLSVYLSLSLCLCLCLCLSVCLSLSRYTLIHVCYSLSINQFICLSLNRSRYLSTNIPTYLVIYPIIRKFTNISCHCKLVFYLLI